MIRSALLFAAGVSAMDMPAHVNEGVMCDYGESCVKPAMKYEIIQPSQPGFQWNDAGGYCGSWAIQRATLAKGAYISQAEVRNHTFPGGGHDNEILSTNIVQALTNLKLDFEGFDYETTPLPQQSAYFKWLKRQLVSGHTVAWMIMWDGQSYPIYGLKPPAGMYGHVEPVVGFQSNHPLSDETVYDDDRVVHFTDGGVNTVYRKISDLPGTWDGTVGSPAVCSGASYCIGPYSFGWAIKGLHDTHQNSLPVHLSINPFLSEPDIRAGRRPNAIKGTVTVTDLEEGKTYNIYRWDSVVDAFTYKSDFVKSTFVANSSTHVYKDPVAFASDSATYYRVTKV